MSYLTHHIDYLFHSDKDSFKVPNDKLIEVISVSPDKNKLQEWVFTNFELWRTRQLQGKQIDLFMTVLKWTAKNTTINLTAIRSFMGGSWLMFISDTDEDWLWYVKEGHRIEPEAIRIHWLAQTKTNTQSEVITFILNQKVELLPPYVKSELYRSYFLNWLELLGKYGKTLIKSPTLQLSSNMLTVWYSTKNSKLNLRNTQTVYREIFGSTPLNKLIELYGRNQYNSIMDHVEQYNLSNPDTWLFKTKKRISGWDKLKLMCK